MCVYCFTVYLWITSLFYGTPNVSHRLGLLDKPNGRFTTIKTWYSIIKHFPLFSIALIVSKNYRFVIHMIYYDTVVNLFPWPHQNRQLNGVFLFYKLFLVFKMSSKTKMISVSETTYKNLARMGTLEDTFDSVISRMIEKTAMSGQTLAGTGQSTATTPQSATSKGADSV